MAQFDANLFLRRVASKATTTVKAHEHTVRLSGAPAAYTMSAVVALAKSQAKEASVSTPRHELEEGPVVGSRFLLSGANVAAFIQGKDTEPAGNGKATKSKAEERATAEPATNGHAS